MLSQNYSILGLLHVGYTIHNMESAVSFWVDLLGIKRCRQQFIDHEYIGRITGIKDCACKIAFIQQSDDKNMVELLEYIRPPDNTLLQKPGTPSHVHMAYLTNDILTYYEDLKSKGANYMIDPVIIDYGFYKGYLSFWITDPLGNYLQIIGKPKAETGICRAIGLGKVCFNVTDITKSVTVFNELLGFDVVVEDTSKSAFLSNFCEAVPKKVATCLSKTSRVVVELWETPGNHVYTRPSTKGTLHLCFLVKGIDNAYHEFTTKGIEFSAAKPEEIIAGINKGAKAVYFKLPGNIWVEIFEGKPT